MKPSLLLEGYARPNKSHLNVAVAKGVKARVALTKQDWTTAATLLQQKPGTGIASLMTNIGIYCRL